MNIYEQTLSFLFSILYGIIISFLYTIFKKYMYFCKKIYNIFNSLLFSVIVTLIYFKIMFYINGGAINYAFLLTTAITFIFCVKYLQKKCKKKSNQL